MTRDGGCEKNAIDVVLVDDRCHIAARAEHGAWYRIVVTLIAVDEADDLEPVLGMSRELAVKGAGLAPAAHDERAAALHDAGEHPAAQGAAEHGDEHERSRHEEECLHGAVHPPVRQVTDPLRQDQEHQRAGKHGVEEIADLVETGNSDAEVVVVVKVVAREDGEPDGHRRDPQRHEEPAGCGHSRQRTDLLRHRVAERISEHERGEVADGEDRGASAHETATRRLPRKGGDIVVAHGHSSFHRSPYDDIETAAASRSCVCHAIVLASPSVNPTVASKPSSARAFVVSGTRSRTSW